MTIVVLTILAQTASIPLGISCAAQRFEIVDAGLILSGTLFSLIGLLIVTHRSHNRIGWLALAIGAFVAAARFSSNYASCAFDHGRALPGAAVAAWWDYTLAPFFVLLPIFVLLPMLFPTGRFLSPSWRWGAIAACAVVGVVNLTVIFSADFRQESMMGVTYPINNPLALLPGDWLESANLAWGFASLGGVFLAIASLVARYRRARSVERMQLKWLAYYGATVLALYLVVFELGQFILPRFAPGFVGSAWAVALDTTYGLAIFVIFTAMPLTIGVALLRYRLYDIDIIIRRTLQYSIVSAVLVVVYFGSVTVSQRLVTAATGARSPIAIVVSTLLIAALFNPLRGRVQRFVDRRFYRQKHDAELVLAQFAMTTRDEVELDALTAELLAVVQETMQPERVQVWLRPLT